MYLKEVTIDGFKSYGQPVTVGPFAPQFNAITGLNGSGKSNILDSICYVMALKSLQQMRVNKLDDLVYKSGQAGVRRARVTLTFDNTNKSVSPPLYRKHDQIIITRAIVVGGRDKYTINNKVARPSEVHQLFHSTGLNVNNPHFLIMQGRITRVINMRPSEILSLVEEAAGTKIYETKSKDSENRMNRKEAELKEIEELINAEINPQMEKLCKDRESHTLWTKLGKGISEKQKLATFLKFLHLEQLLEKSSNQKKKLELDGETTAQRLENERQSLDEHKIKLKEAVSDNSSASLKATLEGLQLSLKSAKSELNDTKVKMDSKIAEQTKLTKQKAKDSKTIATLMKKRQDLERMNADYFRDLNDQTASLEKLQNVLQQKEVELENLRAGNLTELDEEGNATNLADLIADKKKIVAQLQKSIQDHGSMIQTYEDELHHIPSAEELGGRLAGLKKNVKQSESRLKSVQNQLERYPFDEDQYMKNAEQLQEARGAERQLRDEYEHCQRRIRDDKARHLISQSEDIKELAHKRCSDDPSVTASIVGCGYTTFTVREAYEEFYTALEQVAGGKLLHTVIRSDHAVARIFQACESSRKQVSTIPLNRIKPHMLDRNLVAKAKKFEDVFDPLELIEWTDSTLEPALRHIFSGHLVCREKSTAREVVKLGINVVTIDGDLYSTSGGVSGGSVAGFHDILREYRPLHAIKKQICGYRTTIEGIEKYQSDQHENHQIHNKLQHEIEKEQRTFAMNMKLLETEQQTSLAGGREDLIEKLESEKRMRIEKVETEKAATAQLKSWQDKEKRSKKELDGSISKLEKELPALRKTLTTRETGLIAKKSENASLNKEMTDLDATIDAKEKSIEETDSMVQSVDNEATKLRSVKEDKQNIVDELAGKTEQITSDIEVSTEMCVKLKTDIEKHEHRISKLEIEASNQESKHKDLSAQCSDVHRRVESYAEEHPWIRDDPKRHFENFDPRTMTLKKVEEDLERVKEERVKLETRFNKRVLHKMDEAEKNYQAIKERRDNVLQDKAAIQQFISELDRKKKEEVETCQKIINQHFNAIFQTLLPGTAAALEPVMDGKSSGLLMKVAFNGKWKSGLSELSGGQRSLLALSFILSLLKYKPAPLYILDEVDAALDLSHTKNIGKLIHTHFKDSQFIIVSLKANLFTNADVIFKTSLNQGISQVRRLVGSDVMLEMAKDKAENTNEGKRKPDAFAKG